MQGSAVGRGHTGKGVALAVAGLELLESVRDGIQRPLEPGVAEWQQHLLRGRGVGLRLDHGLGGGGV